jgi:DNA-binding LytR/AlgR family response regulator
MRIAICEDEPVYIELIKEKTTGFFLKRNIKTAVDSYTDALLLMNKINEGRDYDLILMDLQTKHSDGMDTAKLLRAGNINTPIIFVTGIEDRAYQGYSVDALDYVVKKDIDKRLPEALERFLEKHRTGMIAVPIKKDKTAVLKIKDILWAESDGRYSRLVLKNPDRVCKDKAVESTYEELESSLSIGKLAEMLPTGDFVEAYKAIFVNISEIKRVENDVVIMSNGNELPLSRRKRNDVLCAVLCKVKEL